MPRWPAAGRVVAATGIFSDGSTQDLTATATWIASGVVTVTSPVVLATVTASGVGGVQASQNGAAGLAATTGSTAVLTSIVVAPDNATLAAGTVREMHATGTLSDGTTQDLTATAGWSTSTGAATIEQSGGPSYRCLAGHAGHHRQRGRDSGRTRVTISTVHLLSIWVSPASPTLAQGTLVQMHATGSLTMA